MIGFQILASDFFVSFVWVWSGSLLRLLADRVLGTHLAALALKAPLAVLYLYLFARLRKATRGGSYNPLLVLGHAISGDFVGFLFAIFARIPAQDHDVYEEQVGDLLEHIDEIGIENGDESNPITYIIPYTSVNLDLANAFTTDMVIGSIIGVMLVNSTFPEAAHGPCLNVDIHQGALTEGVLTFFIVVVSLGLKKIHPRNHAMKTWISSISKVIFHLLGYDITGGIMNPATAFGLAYAEGGHLTKEHWCVYWLAPMEGTLLAVWTCSLFIVGPKNSKRRRRR